MKVVRLCGSPGFFTLLLSSLGPTLRTACHKDDSILSLCHIQLQKWVLETHYRAYIQLETSENSAPFLFHSDCVYFVFLETAISFYF